MTDTAIKPEVEAAIESVLDAELYELPATYSEVCRYMRAAIAAYRQNSPKGITEERQMENQHQKITGYRDLSQEEIDAMNECKALAEQCGALIAKLRAAKASEGAPPVYDQRWVSIGATHLQEGFMAVIRGIAQPTTF